MMREGYEMDSQKLGVLEAGETVMVAERRKNEADIYRYIGGALPSSTR